MNAKPLLLMALLTLPAFGQAWTIPGDLTAIPKRLELPPGEKVREFNETTTHQQPTHQRRQVRVRKVALDYPQRPCHPIPLAEATTATLVVVAGDVGVGAVLVTACLTVSVQAGRISGYHVVP